MLDKHQIDFLICLKSSIFNLDTALARGVDLVRVLNSHLFNCGLNKPTCGLMAFCSILANYLYILYIRFALFAWIKFFVG
jgi:hypothetical protein